MDGDLLTSAAFGYLFKAISIPVASLFRGQQRLPIIRDRIIIGYLNLTSTIELASNSVKLGVSDSQSIAFFKSHNPDQEKLREKFLFV